jgi:hypothetical protein
MKDPVTEFLRLAQSLDDHELEKTEQFLRVQESDLNTLAVLVERPDDQPVALLKIANDGEATLLLGSSKRTRKSHPRDVHWKDPRRDHHTGSRDRRCPENRKGGNRRLPARWRDQSEVLHRRTAGGADGGASENPSPTIMTFPNLHWPGNTLENAPGFSLLRGRR